MAVVRAEKLSESLTEEQRAILGTDVLPGETLKVEAAAGAGKSTVLRLYAERRPTESRKPPGPTSLSGISENGIPR